MRANIKLLPDGSGRVRIHWFRREASGPIQTAAKTFMTKAGRMALGGATGSIACKPELSSLANKGSPVVHSGDPRAVTCPECMASQHFQSALREASGEDSKGK